MFNALIASIGLPGLAILAVLFVLGVRKCIIAWRDKNGNGQIDDRE